MPARHLGDALPRLVDAIVASYAGDTRTQHLDREYLPSKAAMVDICNLLLELTYPGYIGRLGLTRHNIGYHVGELLPRLWEQLARQITQYLCHELERTGPTLAGQPLPAGEPEACLERAESLATRFLERIPAVRALLAEDVQAAYDGDPAATSTAEVILAYPDILAITIHRYAHELYNLHLPLLARVMSEYAHYVTGIDIHPGAQIGHSFFIDHGTGVVIGETSVIGDRVKIYQGVTLGALSFPRDDRGRVIKGRKRHPTIGNHVTIYANAIILGGDTLIGDGAVIGGSVFLTQSVEPGHQVSITPPMLRVRPPRPPGVTGGPAEPILDFSI